MRFELTRIPLVRSLLRNRWPQFILTTLLLAGFIFAILAGFAGTPVGNQNFAIVFTWIAWWAILILVAVPFLGRGWCSVCPIPVPGDWLQRGSLLGPQSTGKPVMRGLNWRWPNKLRNIWLQNGMFVLMALFSTIILTTPVVTSIILAAFLFIAIGTALLFERRAFCRYICPVGGFIGLYSQTSPLELRVIDTQICATDGPKACYNGSEDGYGCPWQVFPPGLVKNTYCGLCMECLRTCPNDNIAVNLRAFSTDLDKPGNRKLDEAFKAFIMLASAIVYAGVLLGPWGKIKTIAFSAGTLPWAGYTLVFLIFMFALMPGLFWLAVKAGQRWSGLRTSMKRAFIDYSYTLVPLGLMGWIAFSLSFVFANSTYVLTSVSDPFGWGWDLFGTASIVWTPLLTGLTTWMQLFVLAGGLMWSIRTAFLVAEEKHATNPGRQAIPVIAYNAIATILLMGLLL